MSCYERASSKAEKFVIHTLAKLQSMTSILLKRTKRGVLDLYKIDKAYIILLINVFGFWHRTVSAT